MAELFTILVGLVTIITGVIAVIQILDKNIKLWKRPEVIGGIETGEAVPMPTLPLLVAIDLIPAEG